MKYSAVLLPLTALVMASCAAQPEEENPLAGAETPAVYEDTAAVTVNDTTKFKFDFAVANIPSPANALQDLRGFGVAYDRSVLHDPNKADKYQADQARAVNLGIYNIDMAYAMLHDKGQDVLDHMRSVMYIGDQLGLRNAVNSMVGKRAENNLNKRDSLFRIIDEIFMKSDSYLRNNARVYTATMIFAGSWIESLHLTCAITQKAATEHRQRGKRILWEQRFHLANLISVMHDFKDNAECLSLTNSLREVHSAIAAVKQDTEMDDKTFDEIAAKIAAVRSAHTGA